MTAWNIIGGLVFSGVGLVAFVYGKRMARFQLMLVGGLLMVYPYFISDTAWMYLVGTALTAVLFFLRD
ncbi:MAG TPA: amino acid transport protein [Elusimicrobia bacterium]|nr:amino acid transport protein [Elusimicrobiota bacterium]